MLFDTDWFGAVVVTEAGEGYGIGASGLDVMAYCVIECVTAFDSESVTVMADAIPSGCCSGDFPNGFSRHIWIRILVFNHRQTEGEEGH